MQSKVTVQPIFFNLSSATGSFTFTSSGSSQQYALVPGTAYRLAASADGYSPAVRDVTFGQDGQHETVVLGKLPDIPIEHTFSITDALSLDIGKSDVMYELEHNQGWSNVIKPDAPVTKMQFGVNPGSQDVTLNDAILHWHFGHGGPKIFYDNQGKPIPGLGNNHTYLALPGSVYVYPNDITEKWGGKNKWVILQSCYILSDLDWGNGLGTTHGILGYASVTNMHQQQTPELSVKFLRYAEGGKTLAESWYLATTEIYHDQKVGTTWIQDEKGNWILDNYAHQDNIIAATIFKDDTQRDIDRLPGSTGYTIANDNSANTFIRNSWDCHTGLPREPES